MSTATSSSLADDSGYVAVSLAVPAPILRDLEERLCEKIWPLRSWGAPGTTCLDVRDHAAAGGGRFSDGFRARIVAGEALCIRCRLRDWLKLVPAAPAEGGS